MLLFRKSHKATILAGVKTATRRNWETRRARPGAVHQCRLQLFGEPFAHVLVDDVYRQPLGDMTEEDALREGGYSLDAFRALWLEMNDAWDPELVVWVVEFQRVPADMVAALTTEAVRRELTR